MNAPILKIAKIHHVAYRCKDAKETVEWYTRNLNMDFVLAIAEDEVPSTHEPDPYMHLFLDAGNGNVLAFFGLLAGLRRQARRRQGARGHQDPDLVDAWTGGVPQQPDQGRETRGLRPASRSGFPVAMSRN